MKGRLRYWRGYWWSYRMGVTGQGLTPRAAWDDMMTLYGEAVRRPMSLYVGRVRA